MITLLLKGMSAILNDDGSWSSDYEVLASLLNSSFGPSLYPPSPSAGINQYANQARAAALALKAELKWSEEVPDDEDRVY